DKAGAYRTLYRVLMRLVTIAAPVIPFITEEIYLNLRDETMPESIHLADYPLPDPGKRDEDLEQRMKITRQAVSMGRALRVVHNLKIRQPLNAMHLVTKNENEIQVLKEMSDIIKEELNVKNILFRENEEDLVEYSAKANYKVLGKQLGKHMKEAAALIENFSQEQVRSILKGTPHILVLNGIQCELTEESLAVQRAEKENLKVLNEGSLTIALDPEITEELKAEGMVRDMVRSIQNLRKESGLDVADRITLSLYGSEGMKKAVDTFKDYLLAETLAHSFTWEKQEGTAAMECGDETCFVSLAKQE
ncbi:MAG: isoleucine--tRNA ligase, partial [Spirochaetales bacterium]